VKKYQAIFIANLRLQRIAYIAIYAPISEGIIYPIHIGWHINVYFAEDKNLFTFQVEVSDRITVNNVAFLEAKIKSDIARIQRREYFRLSYTILVKYRILCDSQKDELPQYNEGYSTDISGGGLCLRTKEKIRINEMIECKFNIDNDGEIKLLGKVVRVGENNPELIYGQEIGVELKKTSKRDVDRIVRFIFKHQRELIQKGLS
jgi:c-di-GMP-binding flagellar brake protein YcgR